MANDTCGISEQCHRQRTGAYLDRIDAEGFDRAEKRIVDEMNAEGFRGETQRVDNGYLDEIEVEYILKAARATTGGAWNVVHNLTLTGMMEVLDPDGDNKISGSEFATRAQRDPGR